MSYRFNNGRIERAATKPAAVPPSPIRQIILRLANLEEYGIGAMADGSIPSELFVTFEGYHRRILDTRQSAERLQTEIDLTLASGHARPGQAEEIGLRIRRLHVAVVRLMDDLSTFMRESARLMDDLSTFMRESARLMGL